LVDWGRIATTLTLGRYAPPSRRLDYVGLKSA